MCERNCGTCAGCASFDEHADQAIELVDRDAARAAAAATERELDLVDQVHAAEMTVHVIEARVPDWSWAHTARMWGVALAQAMLIAAVAVPVVLALAWVVVKVSLLW